MCAIHKICKFFIVFFSPNIRMSGKMMKRLTRVTFIEAKDYLR